MNDVERQRFILDAIDYEVIADWVVSSDFPKKFRKQIIEGWINASS